jgi:hypothetical protein
MARPEISDVVPDPADPDRARVVYWYMNNAEPSTYREAVRYTVYCFEGEAERDPVLVDGSGPGEPSAAIGGLVPGSGYSFQVEAYLEGEPGMTELSALWSGQ